MTFFKRLSLGKKLAIGFASLSMNEQVENLLQVVHSLEELLQGEGHALNTEPLIRVTAVESVDEDEASAAA